MKSQRLVEGIAGRVLLCIECPGFALQLRKITENLSEVNRRVLPCSVPIGIRLVDLAIAGDGLDCPAVSYRPWLPLQATGSALAQLNCLPSCCTRGFPTSANFESTLSVSALMWSGNNGTPRSSCISLLRTYQVTQVARRRHLDFNTCNLRTWERAADLHLGSHSPSGAG